MFNPIVIWQIEIYLFVPEMPVIIFGHIWSSFPRRMSIFADGVTIAIVSGYARYVINQAVDMGVAG